MLKKVHLRIKNKDEAYIFYLFFSWYSNKKILQNVSMIPHINVLKSLIWAVHLKQKHCKSYCFPGLCLSLTSSCCNWDIFFLPYLCETLGFLLEKVWKVWKLTWIKSYNLRKKANGKNPMNPGFECVWKRVSFCLISLMVNFRISELKISSLVESLQIRFQIITVLPAPTMH